MLARVLGRRRAEPALPQLFGQARRDAVDVRAARLAGADYLDPSIRCRRPSAAAITTYTGEAIVASGVDGCGAPAHAVPLVGLARAFARIATAPDGDACGAGPGRDAARPELIGGTGRAVSELTAAVPGLLCKDGSEGVWAAALPDGRAFAVKVDDGAMRALGPLLCAALRHWGVDDR